VRQICGHSGSIDDIVQSQVRDQIRLLQQERQGLTNSTSSTADNDFFFVRIWLKSRKSLGGCGLQRGRMSSYRQKNKTKKQLPKERACEKTWNMTRERKRERVCVCVKQKDERNALFT
jgi:hypothetical protein